MIDASCSNNNRLFQQKR